MRLTHYTDRAVTLAVDLVQAFRDPATMPTAGDLRAILGASGLDGTVTDADVGTARGLAAQLREVFVAADNAEATRVLNLLMATSNIRPHISDHDGRGPHMHFAPPEASLMERVRTNTVVGLSVVVCDYGKDRLGACGAEGCDNVFVDISRNAQRRYCSEACANRSNVAAHRARQRSLRGAEPPGTTPPT